MRRLMKGVDNISRWLAVAGGGVLVLFMVLLSVDAGLRYIADRPLLGIYESSESALVLIIFFCFAYTELTDGHIRAELLVSRLPTKVRAIIEMFTDLCTFSLVGFISLLAVQETHSAIIWRQTTYGIVSIPLWPTKLAMAVGSIAFALQLIRRIIGKFIELTDRSKEKALKGQL